MARVFSQGRWFDQIALTSYREREYEDLVLAHASDFFPEFVAVPFKQTVYSESDAARADIALIDREYRNWWVVEVELGSHSLHGHVIPQIRTLSQASYGFGLADALAKRESSLDPVRLASMLKGRQPRVLVIVNQALPSWVTELRPFGALVAVLEVFRSDDNVYLFRLNGDQPHSIRGVVTRCAPDPTVPKFLRVESPGGLPVAPNEVLTIWHDGRATRWTRMDGADSVWLVPASTLSLRVDETYRLVELGDGTIELVGSRSEFQQDGD